MRFDANIAASGTISAPFGVFNELTVSGQPVSTGTGGGGGAALTVRTTDSNPTVADVDTIVVTAGTLVDDGGGQVTLDTGAGGSITGSSEFAGASVTTSSGIDILDSTSTYLPWDTVNYNAGGDWRTGDVNELVVPSGVTHAQAQMGLRWSTGSVTGRIRSQILLNGEVVGQEETDSNRSVSGVTFRECFSDVLEVSPGDVFDTRVYQDGGVTAIVQNDPTNHRDFFSVTAINRGVSDNVTAVSGTFHEDLQYKGVEVATLDDLNITPTGGSSTVSGVISRPLDDTYGPVALWTFENADLVDEVSAITLTVNGGGTESFSRIGGDGIFGVSLNGSTSFTSSDASLLTTGDLTYEALIVNDEEAIAGGTNKIICGWVGPTGDGNSANNFISRWTLTATQQMQYFAEEGTGSPNISYTGGYQSRVHGIGRALTHVAMVRENDQIQYYVNGRPAGAESTGLGAPNDGSAGGFYISGNVENTDYFTGQIGSVKVFDKALTAAQILNEYERTLSFVDIPDAFVAASGTFSDSLTVSGVPVDITGGGGGGGAALTVKEADGVPTVANVDTIVVTNGTLTDDGSGQVTISTGGSGGGSGGLGQVAASGTIWMPEVAPAVGTQYDDEFVQGTTVSGVESIWTAWDPGTNIHTMSNDEQGLYLRNSNNTGQWMGIFQDVPPDGATGRWVAWTYVSMSAASDLTSGYRKIGFGLFNDAAGAPSTTDFQFLGLTSSPGQDWAIERGEYTSYTDTTPSPADYDKATLNGVHLNGVFLRVIKTNDGIADHSMELAYSFDGVGWKSMTSDDPGFDVAHIGLICVNGAGTTLYRYSSKFFRIDNRYNGASMRVQTHRGNFLDPTGSGVGGGSSFDPSSDQTISGEWDFTNSLTVSGVPVITTLVDTTVSGIIGKKLGTTHDPVALYLFDDNISDSSGNGLDLAVGAGAERYTNVNGLRSLKFDSTNYFRFTPGSTALEITGDITIQFLLTSEDLVGTSYMLSYAAGGDGEAQNALYACRGAASTENYSWFSESGAGVDASYGGWNGSGNHTLHHLTYVRESDIVTLYIDGAPRGSSGTLATPTGGTSSKLDVGAFDGGSIWRGTMSCLKIVSSALTPAQVYAEYASTWADAPSSSSGGSSIDESQVALLSQVFGS